MTAAGNITATIHSRLLAVVVLAVPEKAVNQVLGGIFPSVLVALALDVIGVGVCIDRGVFVDVPIFRDIFGDGDDLYDRDDFDVSLRLGLLEAALALTATTANEAKLVVKEGALVELLRAVRFVR